ncbi:MAG: hypothetical protein ACLS9I_11930, partial [Adlercreutzia equolifaciens]
PFRVYRKWVYVNGGLTAGSGLNASSTPKWSTCGMEVRHSGPQVAEKCQLRAEMAEGGGIGIGHFGVEVAFAGEIPKRGV